MAKPAKRPRVVIIMGSDSDYPIMKGACEALKNLGVECEASVLSAHRTPEEAAEFARSARKRGVRVIIAGAGGAAHLAGVVAALTTLPVIGVPIGNGPLGGQDSLYSIVQMPKGIPVATVAINGAYNAGLLAAQILAAGGLKEDARLAAKLVEYKEGLRRAVLAKKL